MNSAAHHFYAPRLNGSIRQRGRELATNAKKRSAQFQQLPTIDSQENERVVEHDSRVPKNWGNTRV